MSSSISQKDIDEIMLTMNMQAALSCRLLVLLIAVGLFTKTNGFFPNGIASKNKGISNIGLDNGRLAQRTFSLGRVQITAGATSSLEDDHDKDVDDQMSNFNPLSSRRMILSSCLVSAGAMGLSPFELWSDGPKLQAAHAAVTDETDRFGDNWWTKDIQSASSSTSQTVETRKVSTSQSKATPSDEVQIAISKRDLKLKEGLGIELGEIEFRTNLRVVIKSITPGSTAERLGIRKDWVVVAIDGESTERTNAEGVAIMVYRAARKPGAEDDEVLFTFRDPAIFRSKLNAMSSAGDGSTTTVTTQVAPAGDTTQRNKDGSVKAGYTEQDQSDQRLTVTQLVPPKLCKRGAEVDDLLEISYIGTVVETGQIFDGSAVKINNNGIPGRGNDVSLFFVLGKQPFGQFPPGWDVGLYGICVGERRRLIIPPVLAYGSTGLPRRGIPPNSTLQYDVTLVSLNGLATPQ